MATVVRSGEPTGHTIGQPAEPVSAEVWSTASNRLLRTAPNSVTFKKLRKRLVRQAAEALVDFAMGPYSGPAPRGNAPQSDAHPGAHAAHLSGSRPRWLVCVSGGKDSHALLAVLIDLVARGDLLVDLLACNLDQGQPGFPKETLPAYFAELGIPFHIETVDTYSRVMDRVPAGQTYCALCSRYRRAILYRVARQHGCTAIVLGHHREDILETFLLNLFHGGRLAAMPPKLLNEDGDLLCLRPLAYCAEDDLARFAGALQMPIIPCDLCGSQDGLQRQSMKTMLAEWETRMPGRKDVMLRALAHTRPSHLLDREIFDFAALNPE